MTPPKASSAKDARQQLVKHRLVLTDAHGKQISVTLSGKIAKRRDGRERHGASAAKKDQILLLHKRGQSIVAICREVNAPDSYVRSVLRRHVHVTQPTPKVQKARPNKDLLQAKSEPVKVPLGFGRRPDRRTEVVALNESFPSLETQTAATQLAKALSAASPSVLITATSTLTSQDVRTSDDERPVLGPTPTKQELADAVLANLNKQFTARKAVESQSVSRDAVAAALGTSATAVGNWMESGKLTGFRVGRRWMFPAWQLDAETANGLVAGLRELIDAFPGGAVPLTRWIHKPSADLGNTTPYEALREGRADEVATAARALVP